MVEDNRLPAVMDFMQRVTTASTLTSLRRSILECIGVLLGNSHEVLGAIGTLDSRTGEVVYCYWEQGVPKEERLPAGAGITAQAIKGKQITRVDNVAEDKRFIEIWPGMESELAIPMVLDNTPARIGREVRHVKKLVGILNFESPQRGAFSQVDDKFLMTIAGNAAGAIERLQNDSKQQRLRAVERTVYAKREAVDDKEEIDFIGQRIINGMDASYVNISLVSLARNAIRTKYVVGLSEQEQQEFKQLADHKLDGVDIQAHIYRNGQIEVPEDPADPRFDKVIYRTFSHERYIRVYIPLIAEAGVVGTVEVAYLRQHTEHIYEADIQLLRAYADLILKVLLDKRLAQFDRVWHETIAPITGIRDNARFLQRHWETLPPNKIARKLRDIESDGELLDMQIFDLEYTLLGRIRRADVKFVIVYRDIIIKVVNQMRHLLYDKKLPADEIRYNDEDIHKIRLYVDQPRLNQVVFNLLRNAIKYADKDPSKFAILIDIPVDFPPDPDNYHIRFRDWGIGIKPEYKDKIFEEGFRTPEARQLDPTGSGLGLAISRLIMRDMGGDLVLVRWDKPTEFRIKLPKSLRRKPREKPDDTTS